MSNLEIPLQNKIQCLHMECNLLLLDYNVNCEITNKNPFTGRICRRGMNPKFSKVKE